MLQRKPNIRNKHFEFDDESEEYTCKTCATTYSELDAIGHLMEVHDYHRVDLILDEVKED
jgi:protein-arginine kinase activator protein McsA